MADAEPLVSVVIPTYNRPDFLKGAIETVTSQTLVNLEVIVVDDGSEENYARKVVDEFPDSRIRVEEHDSNKGLSAARNTGTREAEGEYIAYLDDDDRWQETKLEQQVAVRENQSDVGLVTCCTASINSEGEILRCEASKPSGDLSNAIFRMNIIGTPSRILVRRECFEDIGLFDTDLPTKQDWDFYIRLCQNWRVYCFDDILCFRTVHSSMSSDPEAAERDLMRIRERYRETIEERGMWEESMAAYHRKIGITYLFNGERKSARRHLWSAMKYEPTPVTLVLNALGYIPHSGFLGVVRVKRSAEKSLNSCAERIPSEEISSENLIGQFGLCKDVSVDRTSELLDLFIRRVYAGPVERMVKSLGIDRHLSRAYWEVILALADETHTRSVAGVEASFKITTPHEYTRFHDPTMKGETDVLEEVLSTLKSDDVFYDVGANVGLYTCFAGRKTSNGHVVAFEPHPLNVGRIEENARLNDLEVMIHGVALAEEDGSATLEVDADVTGVVGHVDKEAEGVGTSTNPEIELRRGDGMVESGDIPAPNVVKIDVDGGEADVISGLEETLGASECRRIYCEIHPGALEEYGASASEVHEMLEKAGFELTTMEIDHQMRTDAYFVRGVK